MKKETEKSHMDLKFKNPKKEVENVADRRLTQTRTRQFSARFYKVLQKRSFYQKFTILPLQDDKFVDFWTEIGKLILWNFILKFYRELVFFGSLLESIEYKKILEYIVDN